MSDENEVIDLKARREELEALRREALSYGYALEGETLPELRQAVEKMRGERQGKPGCYRRNYGVAAPQCQICDLRVDCANGIVATPSGDLEAVGCLACEQGLLRVELTDEATGDVRDYACSSTGCTNTLLRQSGWRKDAPASVYDIPIPPDIPDPNCRTPSGKELQAEVVGRRRARAVARAKAAKNAPKKKAATPLPIEELDRQILQTIRDQGGVCPSQEEFLRRIGCSANRLRVRLQFLAHAGTIKIVDRTYRIGDEA